MRIAEVIGSVTLNRCLPSFEGASLKVVGPLSFDELAQGAKPAADQLVVWDDLGVGNGSRIAMTEGGEAAQPFLPEHKPVDAYNAALLDSIEIHVKNLD